METQSEQLVELFKKHGLVDSSLYKSFTADYQEPTDLVHQDTELDPRLTDLLSVKKTDVCKTEDHEQVTIFPIGIEEKSDNNSSFAHTFFWEN